MSASVPATAVVAQIRLESNPKQPVEFAFDDTNFTVRNLTKSTSVDPFVSQSSHLYLFCSIDQLTLEVPLSRVLWVGISGPVIDVHLLVKDQGPFKLTTVSASFKGDDPNALSTASNWVQNAMTAAYGGALRCEWCRVHLRII